MIRTGEQYRAALRDGREIWIDGERVRDVTVHPAFEPIVDAKARMYDMVSQFVAGRFRQAPMALRQLQRQAGSSPAALSRSG